MDVTRDIEIDSVRDEQLLERVPHVDLILCSSAGVHGTMAHRNDPRCLRTINLREVIGQPLVLLVVLGVVHTSNATVNSAERTSIDDRCLVLKWEGSAAVNAGEIVLERLTRRICIVLGEKTLVYGSTLAANGNSRSRRRRR